MPDSPDAAPERSWLPLAIAGAIALLVVVGAIVVNGLRSGSTPAKAAAVAACEAAYAASAGEGGTPPRIVAGDVYADDETDELRAFLEEQGLLDSAGVDVDEAGPTGVYTVVWWLETEEHLQCTVEVAGDVAVDGTVQLGALAAPG